jgi:hypothetical protein
MIIIKTEIFKQMISSERAHIEHTLLFSFLHYIGVLKTVAELGGKLWAGQCKIKVQKNVLKHTSLLNISALVTDQRSYTQRCYQDAT